jgi:hypothetical protein
VKAGTEELIAVGAIVAANVAVHTVVPDAWHVPANVVLAGAVTGLAVRAGVGLEDLGLAPEHALAGLRIGLAAASSIGSVVRLAQNVDRARALFADDKVGSYTRSRSAYELAVRIPVGTALAEELVFRGALPALVGRRHSPRTATLVSSALFGLWHVAPTRSSLQTSEAGSRLPESRQHRIGAVVAVVAATAVAGLAFDRLRRRSGSLIAPIVAHAALNSAAFAAARAVARR